MKKYKINNQKNLNKKNKDVDLKRQEAELLKEKQRKQFEERVSVETNVLIEKLNNDAKKTWNRTKKTEALTIASELQVHLNNSQFELLDSKLIALKEIEKEEATKKEELKKNVVPKEPRRSPVEVMKSIKYPLITRTIKIVKEETGKERWIKLSLLYGAFLILMIIFLVGILLYFNVIPNSLGIDETNSNIVYSVMFSVPIALIIFVL